MARKHTDLDDVVDNDRSSMSVVRLFRSSASQTAAYFRDNVFTLLTRLCTVNISI